ncbi:MAG: type II toxin-antitoxin system PemK/MazF family toxin [Thaumarchaeota archaeon]|nr:type II toxin-antitoxin system PemK/MazF family toxin [Nitrososphaerota archaeon]
MISQREIVLISFPFSDLQTSKVRPAVVMSKDSYNSRSGDFIAVPLTSNLKAKGYTLLITNKELESGNLVVDSKAKVDRIFSVSQSLVRMTVGKVKTETYQSLVRILVGLVSAGKR